MTMCWSCGRKIQGTVNRSWETTSYSQRNFASFSLRGGRFRVGGSSGQGQSVVSACDACYNALHPKRVAGTPFCLEYFLRDIGVDHRHIPAVKTTLWVAFWGIVAAATLMLHSGYVVIGSVL